jgi:hypothetical protein
MIVKVNRDLIAYFFYEDDNREAMLKESGKINIKIENADGVKRERTIEAQLKELLWHVKAFIVCFPMKNFGEETMQLKNADFTHKYSRLEISAMIHERRCQDGYLPPLLLMPENSANQK